MQLNKEQIPLHLRDDSIDTLKGVLIIMVVLGHLLFPLIEQPVIKTVYLFLYLVHMPLFSFLSGYLYRLRPISEQISRLLIPYLFFQMFYVTTTFILFSTKPTLIGIINPFGHLWYIWVLFFWGYLYELLKQFKGAFFIAIVAGCFIQIIEQASFLETTRLFTFFPFFLSGIYLSKKSLQDIKSFISWHSAFFVVCCIILSIFFIEQQIDYRWVLRMHSYSELGFSNLQGIILSFLLYLCSLLLCLIITRTSMIHNTMLAQIGKMSMYIYLWHYIFVLLWYTFFSHLIPLYLEVAALTIITTLIIYFLTTSKNKSFTDHLFGKTQRILLKQNQNRKNDKV